MMNTVKEGAGARMSKALGFGNEPARTNRPLIVSYSYSGNTRMIAQAIHELTLGDWLEIHPWQPYPVDFAQLLAQIKRENRAGHRPRLLPLRCTPHTYRIILVGSPNWCGTIAPPLASWLQKNDLGGKIILPFYSHCGGVSGDIRGDIARLCPKADVREALSVIGSGGEYLNGLLLRWFAQAGVGALDSRVD